MSNAKPALGRTRTHTSGEWTPEDNGIFFTINCDPFLNGKHAIAECFGPDREANAVLIVAAPKILDMLKRLTELAYGLNKTQHAGVEIAPGEWALLYQLTNEAKGILSKTEKD